MLKCGHARIIKNFFGQSNYETIFRLIFRMLASVALLELGSATVHCLVPVGTIFFSNEESGRFLKTVCEEHQGNYRKSRERTSGHTCPLFTGSLIKIRGQAVVYLS